MKRKRSTKILPRKFEPAFAVPGNVKLKLPNIYTKETWLFYLKLFFDFNY
jgi:hypothetical protein